ncbi:unnamed protein product [Trypanosoma congolense IL3000]|uniref:WGS project CAEQ00000000 data, annotated contig 191 n=1 Tax=Trypanosoma congolense (strain IL3000) TaxID=1068625 RepID=F9W9Z1_TRYCI|nr:unnamed protein product [Trypanosoma congolense IL3000]
MKQSHVENGSMLLPPSGVATESALCSDDSLRTWQHCSSWRISDGEQQLRRGAEVDLINEKTQLAGGKGRADESLGGDDTGGCCCCGCPSLFCFHLFGRRCGSELCCPHQEEQSSINGNTGTVLMLRPNSSADLSSGMRRLLPFQVFNNFSGDVSAASYIFCLLNYAAAISMIGTGCLHLMDTLNDRVSRVADGSVCDGVVLLEPITPDMVFTLVCFTINITAACIFAHRAVRYQHNGSLLCHLLAVLLVIGCFVNYLFGPHRGTVIRRISAWEIAALSGNVVLTATSCFLYAPVSKDFAWRLFMKGITLTSLIQQRRRWMHIQSCVQVDVLSAINTALVALYLVTSRLETWATVSLCALSVFMALHFTTMLKCQARWFLLLFIVLAAVSTGFNCYIAALGAGEYFVTNTMTHYDQGRCYRDMLQNCVWSTVTSLNSRNQAVSFLGSNVLSVMQRSNMSCVEDEPTPSGIVSNCCLDYGLCRLRDSVRFYASGAIMALVIITTTVRLLLVRLWIQTPVEQTSATGSVPITLVSSDIGGALAAGKQGTRGMRE